MSRGRAALAILLSFLLIVAGAMTAGPARADAGPTLTVSKTTDLDPAGETVTVTGSGYDPSKPMYLTTCTDVPLSDVSFTFIAAGCTTGAKVVTPNPRAGNPAYVQLNADGTFETTFTVTPKSGSTAIYTIADHTAMNDRSQDAKQTITFRSVPTLTVSKTTDLDPAGETVTVTGSGYDPAKPMYLTTCTDVPLSDVSFTFIAAGCTTGAKVVTPNPRAGNPAYVQLNADGTFETTFTVTPKSGSTAIYTIADHTAMNDRSQDAKQTITFRAAATATTSVTVASAITGLSVKVGGSGLGGVTAAYVALIPKGTEDAVTSESGFAAMNYAAGISAGAFTTTLVAAPGKLDRATQYEVIVWREHSNPSASTIYTRADVTVTPEQWNAVFPGTAPAPVPPQPEQPQTVAGGSLSWSISRSFASYITGPVAHGAIAVSGGATSAGGAFQFGQADGSTFDGSTGTVSYVGAVRFTGHGGVLDVTIANPQIRFSSPTSATLVVTSGGRQVEFATLNIGAGSRADSNGATTFTNVPAALTSAGLNQVLNGFDTTLDALTFTIGAAAAAPAGTTGTIAAAVSTTRSFPATPPATTGIDADPQTLEALQSGRQVTITVSGFQPYEKDIAIVVYSTPVLLGTVDADANGVATWTGTLPATLADGDHTLTFQGSVSRGIQFTLARAASTAAAGECTVDGAVLNWGFKETFRSYIEGIAHGGWELTDVVYDYPDYVWSNGTGPVSLASGTGLVSFPGSLTFTGHEGVLNTTLSNARLELAGDTGYLVFDVSGTTQSGQPVDAKDVRFAEFDLAQVGPVDGVLTIEASTSTLTDAGSAAFGTYPGGEEMDPVTVTLPVGDGCDTVRFATGEEAQSGVTTADAERSADGTSVWPWIVGAAVLLVIAIIVAVMVLRRRKVRRDQA